MKTFIIAASVLAGSAAGNFLWQYFRPVPDYSLAFGYTYHEVWVVITLVLALRFLGEKDTP